MKRRVFVGSSREASADLDLIAAWLEGDGVEAVPWNDPKTFSLSSYTLPALIGISKQVDGAVLIFTPDDKTWFRGTKVKQPRDNVVLEYGIFAARLGPERTIMCLRDDPKVASDLEGLLPLNISRATQDMARKKFSLWARKLPSAIDATSVPSPKEQEALVRLWSAGGVNEPIIVSRLRRLGVRPEVTALMLKRTQTG